MADEGVRKRWFRSCAGWCGRRGACSPHAQESAILQAEDRAVRIMTGRNLVLARLVLVAIACPPGAQIARFGIRDDKPYVEEKSGRSHELPAAKVDRNSLRLSPDGRRLIYHMEFAGYGHGPRIPVKVWSADQPGRLAEFQVPTYSRFLDFVEWVDARRVLIGGDRYGVVLDVDKGVVARKIPGNCFPSRRTGARSRAGRGAPSACPRLCRTG